MIADPPFEDGANHLSLAALFAAVAVSESGALGTIVLLTRSTTSTQSLLPSAWADGYDTDRLIRWASDAEIVRYRPVMGLYQRSRTRLVPTITVAFTTTLRADGK